MAKPKDDTETQPENGDDDDDDLVDDDDDGVGVGVKKMCGMFYLFVVNVWGCEPVEYARKTMGAE